MEPLEVLEARRVKDGAQRRRVAVADRRRDLGALRLERLAAGDGTASLQMQNLLLKFINL